MLENKTSDYTYSDISLTQWGTANDYMNENVKDRLLHRSYSYCTAPMIDLLERNFYAFLIKSKSNIDKSPDHFQTQQWRLYIKSHADIWKKTETG